MRDYGKVHSTFWSSQTTARLADDAKMLALYLMTCSHSTIAGVFRLPDGYIAEDMGWTAERAAVAFVELQESGFAVRCAATKWVWVKKHLQWNKPENPNQRKSAAKLSFSVPESCTWRVEFLTTCGQLLGLQQPLPNGSATLSQPGTEAEAEAGLKTHTPLPQDWKLPSRWGEWALSEAQHWTAETARAEAAHFADHYHACAGESADWLATWRKWCRDDLTQRRHRKPAEQPVRADAPSNTVPSAAADKTAAELAAEARRFEAVKANPEEQARIAEIRNRARSALKVAA